MPNEPPSPPDAGASICTDCGLCCNGAIFDSVPTEEEERDRLVELGFRLRSKNQQVVFDQPCRMLSGRLCTVYAARPAGCAVYRCKLLRAYDGGEVPRSEALSIIGKARHLLDQLLELLDGGESVVEARHRWIETEKRRTLINPQVTVAENPQRTLRMFMLNRFLDKHFRRDHQRQVSGAVKTPPEA